MKIELGNINLTENFTLSEMLRTSKKADNSCEIKHILNLHALCIAVLQQVRRWFGLPVKVNSGYRSLEVNTLVGGAENSQHMQGEAADITLGNATLNKQLFNYIKEHLPFDQLIDEKNYRWIHVSYKRLGNNRKQVLHLK